MRGKEDAGFRRRQLAISYHPGEAGIIQARARGTDGVPPREIVVLSPWTEGRKPVKGGRRLEETLANF